MNCEDDSSDSGSDYEPIILPLMKKDIDQNNLHLKAEQIKLKHEHDRKCNGMNANIKGNWKCYSLCVLISLFCYSQIRRFCIHFFKSHNF